VERVTVEETLADASGTAPETEWSAWRVRAAALCREVLARLEEARASLVAGQAEAARSVLLVLLRLADQLVEAKKAVQGRLNL
jgi:hypothetical protein